MKRFLIVLLAAFLALAPTAVSKDIDRSVMPSIRPLTQYGEGRICTIFSINKVQGYWATAAHCLDVGRIYFIDGDPAYMVDRWDEDDLAVMRSRAHEQALKFREKDLELYDEVYVIGYPYHRSEPVAVAGIVAAKHFIFNVLGDNHMVEHPDRALYAMPLMPGHSGSPVLDREGRVVGVAQLADSEGSFSGGLQLDKLKRDLKRYIE